MDGWQGLRKEGCVESKVKEPKVDVLVVWKTGYQMISTRIKSNPFYGTRERMLNEVNTWMRRSEQSEWKTGGFYFNIFLYPMYPVL